MEKKLLKPISKSIEATVRIGKNGLTENLVNEIKKQLQKRNIVKIKFLKSFIADKDKRKIIQQIVEKTGGELVHAVGFSVTLYKKS